LGIEAARRELLRAADFLAAFPPIGIMWGVGNRLGAGLLLRDLGPVGGFIFLA